MKGWIRFGPNEAPAEPVRSWHKAVEVVVTTACEIEVVTDERPGAKAPGYGARICEPCLAAKDADAVGRVG